MNKRPYAPARGQIFASRSLHDMIRSESTEFLQSFECSEYLLQERKAIRTAEFTGNAPWWNFQPAPRNRKIRRISREAAE